LVVALDTVKKHVSHILDKLDASNRNQRPRPRPGSHLLSTPGRATGTALLSSEKNCGLEQHKSVNNQRYGECLLWWWRLTLR
jgi:hypothetical protein